MGVASVLAHADVRSAPGRSSGEDVKVCRRLGAAAYWICTRKRFELSPGCERDPALTELACEASGAIGEGRDSPAQIEVHWERADRERWLVTGEARWRKRDSTA